MVFFNCNACGESLKKNQVERHYQFICQNCEVVSCVDCGKDFWGDTFKAHIKCISEEEKYSGKNYKPKVNANKGEAKQEVWIQLVQDAIHKAPANNSKLKNLLLKLKDYPNIPRKKTKFQNFLKNSLRILDSKLAVQVWDTLGLDNVKLAQKPQESCENGIRNDPKLDLPPSTEDVIQEQDPTQAKKLSKRQRKEERKKQKHKAEKKDKTIDVDKSTKSNKKRKHHELDEENKFVQDVNNGNMKKRKHKVQEPEDITEEETESEEMEMKINKKFHWETIIVEVLDKADGKEVSIKKLRKKVLAEYASQMADGYQLPPEKLYSKFNKKLKNRRFRVLKERVKLMES